MELDADTVEQARRRSPGLEIRHGDIRALPYRSRSFDAVLDLSTLDHVPAQDTGAVIAEYARVLRHEGRIVLVCWTKPMDEEHGGGIAGQNYFARGRIDGEFHVAFRLEHREVLFVGQREHAGAELVLWRGVRR